MTAIELSSNFDRLFDSISPDFNNREKSEFLSQAQENIYLDIINPIPSPRSSAIKEELNKIIISELVRNTGELLASPNNTVPSSELLSTTGWTTTGWTGSYPNFTHTIGNTTVLSNSIAAIASNIYYLEYTITNRTTGGVTISFGGESTTISASGSLELKASTTGNLTITPTSNFNGTIRISLKNINTSSVFINLPYGHFVFLPEDFFFPLTEFTTIEFLPTNYYYDFYVSSQYRKTNVQVKPISQLDYNYGFWSHIRNPYEDLVWRMEYGRTDPTSKISSTNKKVYEILANEDFKIYSYKATYYRRLIDIDIESRITSELDPFIHRTIVKDAVRIASGAIKDKDRYQISTLETNK